MSPRTTSPRGVFDALVSRLDSVFNVATGLGGAADKGQRVGVDTTTREFTQKERDALARKDGYLGAWFDRLADEAVLSGWDLKVGAEFVKQYKDDDRRLHIAERLREALWVAFKDGGSLVMLVTDDARDDMSKPLDLTKVKNLQAVHVFDDEEFQAYDWNTDLRQPGFRSVSMWSISPQASSVTGKGMSAIQNLRKVHASRCIYVPGREISTRLRYFANGMDDPYVMAVWDALKDMKQIDQGGAVLAQEMKETVIKMAGLEAADASAHADALLTRMRTIATGKGLLGAIILDSDDEYESRTANASGYKDLKGGAKATWAANTHQPETVAFGATPGGLNTDGEAGRKAWDRVVDSLRKKRCRPFLLRYYEVLLAASANRGERAPEDWDLVFRHLGTLTTIEDAQVRERNAMADRIYIQQGVLTANHVREHRFGAAGYQYDLPPLAGEVPDPTRVMDGPQARAMLEFVLQGAAKSVPRASMVTMLRVAFQLTPADAEAVADTVGESFFVDPLKLEKKPDIDTPDLQIQTAGRESE